MKNTKLFVSILLCYSGLVAGAAEPQAAMLEKVFSQSTVHEALSHSLCTQDIVRLGNVNQRIRKAIDPAILKVALWKSNVLNALYLSLGRQKENHPDNQTFKDYVIQSIKDFAARYPGRWIKLDLSENNLGNDVEFLIDLLNAVITVAHTFKIDFAYLDLGNNKLASLPEHLFARLNNLQELCLYANQLVHLPRHIFEGLNNLQELGLANNRLVYLPADQFASLNNLRLLILGGNQLVNLPEHLFDNLNHLQELNLGENCLKDLPEALFKSLNNLQVLWLDNNQLVNLPKNLFKGLNNLSRLSLCHGNQLNEESCHLLEGLLLHDRKIRIT